MGQQVNSNVVYMAPKEIAERFDVKVHTVMAWIKSGELKAINTVKNRASKPRWKIRPEDLERFEMARMSGAEAVSTPRQSKSSKPWTKVRQVY